jgi:hypothetical protein
MIVYELACGRGHFFEGWFASSDACDQQAADGHLQCPTCASLDIRKLPAAPYVKGSSQAPAVHRPGTPARSRQQALAALRQHILANTDNVGGKFAEIARRMHYREEEARNIRGEATIEEAQALEEEGIEAYAISPEVLPPGKIH